MAQLGQSLLNPTFRARSAFLPVATKWRTSRIGSFVPKGDIKPACAICVDIDKPRHHHAPAEIDKPGFLAPQFLYPRLLPTPTILPSLIATASAQLLRRSTWWTLPVWKIRSAPPG
jgi:hypothetical protein